MKLFARSCLAGLSALLLLSQPAFAARMDAASEAALAAGEVGFVVAGIKELRAAKVGDTLTRADQPAAQPLQGGTGQGLGECAAKIGFDDGHVQFQV